LKNVFTIENFIKEIDGVFDRVLNS